MLIAFERMYSHWDRDKIADIFKTSTFVLNSYKKQDSITVQIAPYCVIGGTDFDLSFCECIHKSTDRVVISWYSFF